jgi:hypothetical protein
MRHLIIDNYLDTERLKKLHQALLKIDNFDSDNTSRTEIESKKIVYKIDFLPTTIRENIEFFGSEKSKSIIRELTGWNGDIISLIEMPNFGGYAPLHQMERGGFLGSHIDHTYANNGEFIHIANCIFFAHNEWVDNWHGETILFDKTGLIPKNKITPKPNRMLFFTHDARSFHGVSQVECPQNIKRITFYMDFYISSFDLEDFKESFKNKHNKNFEHFNQLTTFIPVPPSKFGFKIKAIFKREFPGYLRNYFNYLKKLCNLKI